ncbi:MAG: hypothetical protein WDZ94_04210 [Patescibacteria group bacterium]
MTTNLDPFHQKKTVWSYISSALHFPHRETKAEQLWHLFLRSLISLSLLATGFLLGVLFTHSS